MTSKISTPVALALPVLVAVRTYVIVSPGAGPMVAVATAPPGPGPLKTIAGADVQPVPALVIVTPVTV
jgi:hypothetical protein